MSSFIISNDEGSSSIISQDKDQLTSNHATTPSSSLESSVASMLPIRAWEGNAVSQGSSFPPIYSLATATVEQSSILPKLMQSHKTSKKPFTGQIHTSPPNPLASMTSEDQSTVLFPGETIVSSDHTTRSFHNLHTSPHQAPHSSPIKVFYGPNEVVTVPGPLKNLFVDPHESSTMNTTVPEFMFQLTKLLSENNKEYIEWVDGVIKVHDPPKLASDVLHKYFRHSKYSSFQRQLNYFGFRKISGKGKLAPCSYVNDQVTCHLLSLLSLKRIHRPNKAETDSDAMKEPQQKMDAPKQDYTSLVEQTDVSKHQSSLTNPVFVVNKGTRKRKSHDSNTVNPHEVYHLNNDWIPTESPSSKQRKRSSRQSTRPELNSMSLSHVDMVPMFLDPFQLGMEDNAGGYNGSTAMRRETSLLHLAMIPQVPSVAEFGVNATLDDEEEEALVDINFMDFY